MAMTMFEATLGSRERFKIIVLGRSEWGELITRTDAEHALKDARWKFNSVDNIWEHEELKLTAQIVPYEKPQEISKLPGMPGT